MNHQLTRSPNYQLLCSSTKSTFTSKPGTAAAAAWRSAARSSSRAAARAAATAATAARSTSSPARTSTPSSTSASIPSSRAERGEHGMGSNCTGHGGDDLELAGPDRHARLREDRRPGRAADACSPISPTKASACWSRKGGRGGLGNAHFATSTNRAPRKVQPGEPGEDQGPAPRAEAARRRRPGRLSQRRQVDADRAHLRGAAEDRRLPVHHADAEPRRRAA